MADVDRDDDVVRLLTAGRDREAAERGAVLSHTRRSHDDDDGGRMDALPQFEQLGPVLESVIVALRPEQLDAPTPCTEFTVRGVLEHMIGGATTFAAAYRGVAPPEPEFDDPIAAVQSALADLAASITAPGALDRTIHAAFGDMDGESFARYVVLDGLVHGWDLATATGQPYDPPAELVDAAAEFAHEAVEHLRDGDAFGPEVAPAAGATRIERLAAFTGRQI